MRTISAGAPTRHWVNALQLAVADSGVVLTEDSWASGAPSASPSVCLLYVSQGSGALLCETETLPVRPGYVSFVPSGSCRVQSEEGTPLSFLFFRLSAPEPSLQALLIVCPRPMESRAGLQTIQQVFSLYASGSVFSALMLHSLVFSDLAAIFAFSQPPQTACSPMTVQAASLVQKLLSSKLTVNQLAEAMAVSPATLAKRFRAETGSPLGAYIDRMVFQRARQLLIFSETAIGEIADQLGFCDQFYFSRFFRRIQGETPTQFRRRIRGDRGTVPDAADPTP